MKPHTIKSAHAQRQERPLVLEPAELALDRSDSGGISGCRRDALTHTFAGAHSPVGQRHFVARPLKSAPANVQRHAHRTEPRVRP